MPLVYFNARRRHDRCKVPTAIPPVPSGDEVSGVNFDDYPPATLAEASASSGSSPPNSGGLPHLRGQPV